MLVYVIVPIYNASHFLPKCLESLLRQTYRNIMLILVDDGSLDNSLSICNDYSKKDDRIIVIHKENGGVSSARNAGLDYLFDNNKKGYVAFVDSDDWVDENYIQILVNMLKTNEVDIVCSSFYFFSKGKAKQFKHIDNEKVLSNLEATNILVRDESIQSHSVSKLFKLELWKGIRYDTNLFYMEDQEVIYKPFYKANSVFVTNYAGYYYRQDNTSAVTKTSINNKKIVSGLKGYYYPCLYDGFDNDDKEYLVPSIHNALVNAYLTLIPYYKKRAALDEEKAFIKELNKYIKHNKLVKRYIPKGKNNMIKKEMYLLSPFFYPLLFKVAKCFNH